MKDNSKRPLGDLRQVVQTYLPSLGNVSDTGFTSHVTRLTLFTIHSSSGLSVPLRLRFDRLGRF